MKRIAHEEDPLQWWKEHYDELAILGDIAKKFATCPSTSIPSEQFFSGAGTLYDERRNRLKGENSSKILFLEYILPVLKFEI